VEEGEECDCGFTYEECEEHCCYPRQISEKDRMQNPDAQGCKRKPALRCSPSEGPCCDQSCHFVQQPRVLCKQETECSFTSHCNGTSAQCPVPKPRPNLIPCNDGTQVRDEFARFFESNKIVHKSAFYLRFAKLGNAEAPFVSSIISKSVFYPVMTRMWIKESFVNWLVLIDMGNVGQLQNLIWTACQMG
jgi:hypothetical protein